MEVTLAQFTNGDSETKLCAGLTEVKIVHQVLEDDDSGSHNEQPVTVLPTTYELMQALVVLSAVYSENITITDVQAELLDGSVEHPRN
ncbi:hypothetical protein HPB52_016615 [Rhipicephalus sanguineus]|uniref:Uncharacterized protein n=1 Tax=Rhipicephalus sanguineus TaxID=34632 RepID=A0A9D4STB9_RHISA|nr:hypothetical protein HPB52_015935 [Rhipicephalus sanguineus]KAH7962512.1 hypothetical protein HPB52_016615 [Rhipicephalus sanguineus]